MLNNNLSNKGTKDLSSVSVICDLDNTIAHYTKVVGEIILDKYGKQYPKVTPDYLGDYNLKKSWDVPTEVYDEAHIEGFATYKHKDYEPIDGAQEGLHLLQEAGADIRILTARINYTNKIAPGSWDVARLMTEYWLVKYFSDFADKIEYSPIKKRIFHEGMHDAVVFVDDAPIYLEEIRTDGESAVLLEYTYNAHLKDDFLYIKNWSDPNLIEVFAAAAEESRKRMEENKKGIVIPARRGR